MTVEELYERYYDELTGYMTRYCGNPDQAQDFVQQAFSKAIFALPPQMPEPAARAWLYATARNASIDMARKQRRLAYMDEPPEEASGDLDIAGRMQMEAALSALPEDRRRMVQMRYLSGYTSVEIGRAFGMPDSTVRYHLTKAMQLLRTYFKEEES